MTDIEPPTDDLRALFAGERDISAADRLAIRSKLATTIAAPAPATAAIATTKVVWIAVAAIATTAAIWWWTHRAAPVSVPVPTPVPETTAPAPEPSIAMTSPESPAPAAVPEAPAATQAAVPSQTELLAQAWKALPGDPAHALSLVELDARAHAKGALAEERDALHVQALAALGRTDDARARATAFLARYPQSVHKKKIEAVLE